jgi:hypothetical protein
MSLLVNVPSSLLKVSETVQSILCGPEIRDNSFFNSKEGTDDLVLAVKRSLPSDKTICDTEIKADMLLLSMMDCAVDDDARRYTACALLIAGHKGLLVEIAEVWLYYLLCPGMSTMFKCHSLRNSTWIQSWQQRGHSRPRSLLFLTAARSLPFFNKLTTAIMMDLLLENWLVQSSHRNKFQTSETLVL